MTLPIETERLILRRYTEANVLDVIEFVRHPSVDRVTPDIEATEAGVRKYIKEQNSYQPFELDKCFDLAIELKTESKVIGLLTFIRKAHQQAELGYALSIDHRGQGLATEAAGGLIAYAFRTLSLHRIEASTSHKNQRSWRLMERLGMRQEGHLRETRFRDGEWQDTFIYGLLAGEWAGTRPRDQE